MMNVPQSEVIRTTQTTRRPKHTKNIIGFLTGAEPEEVVTLTIIKYIVLCCNTYAHNE